MTRNNSNPSPQSNDTGSSFRPSEFMRKRRPYLFSDTTIAEEKTVPRATLEHHLVSLTSRKQETEFEDFCWRLAEKEICPNLLPQTGPTGGGDSKADTESYPVADTIAIRWFEGFGREARSERWAFAFSAKKQWRPKVRSDIEKIAATNRGYARAFFFSNQFISDKSRAAIEDELSRKHQIDVRIFDVNWILHRVYENGHIDLAIESLGMVGFEGLVNRVAGPEDIRRKAELDETEQRIGNLERYPQECYSMAEDCLRVAVLARELELPRTQIDGLFVRAMRIAGNVGVQRQQLRVAYQYAWTTLWWFDDFAQLDALYSQVEALSIGSEVAADYELITNLWMLLYPHLRKSNDESSDKRADEIRNTLCGHLERIAANTALKNNSLWARKNLLCMELLLAAADDQSSDKVLREFASLLRECDGLAQVPIDSTLTMIRELGAFLGESDAYDELFAVVIEVNRSRRNKGEEGLILLQRGQQKFKAGKKYDAIRFLGQAEQKLPMEEYQEPWVMALGLCGVAYEDVGLLWAARSNILAAINVEATSSTKQGTPSYRTFMLARKLTLIELQLGRMWPALAWWEFAQLVLQNQHPTVEQAQRIKDETISIDHYFSIMLLRTEFSELRLLGFLPDLLYALDLHFACATLLFLLGQIDAMRVEGFLPQEEDEASVGALYADLAQHPAGEDFPQRNDLSIGESIGLRSVILGCEITLASHNSTGSISLSETILGALEAFLATGLDLGIHAHRPKLGIDVRPSEYVSGVPQHWTDNNEGGLTVHVRHPNNIRNLRLADSTELLPWLQTLITDLMVQITLVSDPDSFVKQLLGTEGGLSRALSFSAVEIAVKNTLGNEPKFALTDWASVDGLAHYEQLRTVPWNHDSLSAPAKPTETTPLQIAEPPTSEPIPNFDIVRHNEIRVESLIDIDLWDKAKWKAMAFITQPDQPPVMGLGFGNNEAARLIFAQWQRRIGSADISEVLRVTIVTGISKSNLNRYKVVIGGNPQFGTGDSPGLVMSLSRVLAMDPPDRNNLDRFLDSFAARGEYAIAPCHVAPDYRPSNPHWDLAIRKTQLVVRRHGQLEPTT